MNILTSLIVGLEILNVSSWVLFGLVAVFFMDSPTARITDLWYIPVIIVVLTLIVVSTIHLKAKYGVDSGTFKYVLFIGLILSVVGSFPSLALVNQNIEGTQKTNSISLMIKNHTESKVAFSEEEYRTYMNYLINTVQTQDPKNQKNITAQISDFKSLLDLGLINKDDAITDTLDLHIDFLKTLLTYNPKIQSNADLATALVLRATDEEGDTSTDSIEKFKLLVNHGLNATVKDSSDTVSSKKYSAEDVLAKVKADATIDITKIHGGTKEGIEGGSYYKILNSRIKTADTMLKIISGQK